MKQYNYWWNGFGYRYLLVLVFTEIRGTILDIKSEENNYDTVTWSVNRCFCGYISLSKIYEQS